MRSLAFLFAVISFNVYSASNVIYGEDNRMEVYQASSEYARYASATLARIDKQNYIGWSFNSYWKVIVTSTLEQFGVCKDERFSQQPNMAGCTAFLVSPKHIVTAGHCISPHTCQSGVYRWLFDYHMLKEDGFVLKRPAKDFASCKKVVRRVLDPHTKLDYAIIELEKEVVGREPLKLRRSGKPAIGDQLVVIGHPSGLPTKIADGAEVREVNDVFFKANLDTFAGNSGSPVINTATGEVEGILVRGADDYVEDVEQQCARVNQLPDTAAYESATLITKLVEFLPE